MLELAWSMWVICDGQLCKEETFYNLSRSHKHYHGCKVSNYFTDCDMPFKKLSLTCFKGHILTLFFKTLLLKMTCMCCITCTCLQLAAGREPLEQSVPSSPNGLHSFITTSLYGVWKETAGRRDL